MAGIRRSIERRRSYLDYIAYTHGPEFKDFAPDEIEWALFKLGPAARKKSPPATADEQLHPPVAHAG